MKPEAIALLDSFVDPIVIHHPKGHTVPRLGKFMNITYLISFIARPNKNDLEFNLPDSICIDERALETMLGFIDKILRML